LQTAKSHRLTRGDGEDEAPVRDDYSRPRRTSPNVLQSRPGSQAQRLQSWLVAVLGDRKSAIKVPCGRQPLLPATETGDLYDGIVELEGSNPDARDAGLRV
jgi:hypothetical protein